MKVKVSLDENNSIEFNETCTEMLERSACGMLSGEFTRIAQPFILYDVKRMKKLGAKCDFGYSKNIVVVLQGFGASRDALSGAVSRFVNEGSRKIDIQNFIQENCQKVFELHEKCFSPKLKETEFFTKSLAEIKKLGCKKIHKTGEVVDANEEEIAYALESVLYKVIQGCILESLDTVRAQIKETKTATLKKHGEEIEEENRRLKEENLELQAKLEAVEEENRRLKSALEEATKSGHSEIVLGDLTVAIDTPSATAAAPEAAAAAKPKAKQRRKSV